FLSCAASAREGYMVNAAYLPSPENATAGPVTGRVDGSTGPKLIGGVGTSPIENLYSLSPLVWFMTTLLSPSAGPMRQPNHSQLYESAVALIPFQAIMSTSSMGRCGGVCENVLRRAAGGSRHRDNG